jgi:hypothetical protein
MQGKEINTKQSPHTRTFLNVLEESVVGFSASALRHLVRVVDEAHLAI